MVKETAFVPDARQAHKACMATTLRIRILTVGSYRDVRPYLALARGLSLRKHDVRLLGPDHFRRFAEPFGVTFEGLGPHYEESEIQRTLASMAAEPNEFRHAAIALGVTQASTLAMAERAVEHTRDADVIVAHNMSVLGLVAAEVNKIPFVTGHLFPCLIPSARLSVNGRNFGRLGNRLHGWALRKHLRRTTDHFYNEVLARFGLPVRADVALQSGHSPVCNLVAISPRVLAADPDWPVHYRCTGYWCLPEPAFSPDPALRDFIDQGEPPVVVTFGSMFGQDTSELTRLLIAAVSASGRRAVLQAGWAGLGGVRLPAHVYVAPFVPHDWLFARAACVVHHGGAGTTAAALRAGKPQVIASHITDQPFWSRHMLRLGVSAGGISHRQLSAPWLANAIRRAVSDPALAERAVGLAAELRGEDGVTEAVGIIEGLAQAGPRQELTARHA